MNGKTAKATRRDLRRAVGVSVLQTIHDQDIAIKWLVQQVQTLRVELDRERERINAIGLSLAVK